MTAPTHDQIATLSAALEVFSRRHKLVDSGGKDKPLNELDNQTLLFVSGHPGCGPTDVARFLNVATTTISSATDRLVKRGFLKRERLQDDRRAVALALSDEGEAYLNAYKEAHDDMFRMMLEALSPRERELFIGLIAKIARHEG